MKVHLDNFHIAGFGFWDGCEAFEHLKIGTRLDLIREADNPFDPYAVAIYYGEYKLGFIPRGSNHDISKYLDMGLKDIYEVRITQISPKVYNVALLYSVKKYVEMICRRELHNANKQTLILSLIIEKTHGILIMQRLEICLYI